MESGRECKQNENERANLPALEKLEKCHFCESSEVRLLRCSRCKQAFYCSQNHQRLHWKTHKPNCKPSTSERQIHLNNGVKTATFPIQSSISSVVENSVNKNYKQHSLPLYAVREFDINVDDYCITNSPAVQKVTMDDYICREDVEKNADYVVEKMLSEGYCIIDNFLGEGRAGKVLWDVTSICRSGIMKPGQTIARGHNETNYIRGDIITWITGKEEAYDHMRIIMGEIDRLIRYCTGRLGNVKGRTPAMVACYPSKGTGYKRHIDNTTKDGRMITCLYYLNKGWQADEYGGSLRLFPVAKQGFVDVVPYFDRFCMFWSDRRTPHEVLPSYHQRFAVTLWYFNAQEREDLKEQYFSSLKNAFAANVSMRTSKGGKKEEAYKCIPSSFSSSSSSTTTTTSRVNDGNNEDEPHCKK